jgi:capsule polysaccharide export protein KpsE/RkpR
MPPDQQSVNGLAMLAASASAQTGLGSLAGGLLGIKSTGALFIGVMRSHAVESRIIDRFDLQKVYRARLKEDARKNLSEMTFMEEDRKSGIITLTVTDRDPKRAAAIANAYVEELNNLMAELTTSSAHRERVFLEERLATVKHDLETAEKDLGEFSSKNSTVDIASQAKAMVEATATLQGQLIASQSELDGLRQIYTDRFPRIRELQARINDLQRELQTAEAGTESQPPKNGDASNVTKTSGDSSYPTLRQLPILGVTYGDKLRRSKIEEAVFETLTKEYELSKVQEAKEIPTVRVLDPPEVPERKSYPHRFQMMMLGMIGAFLAGVLWVLGKSGWDQVDPEDPNKIFAKEVFGTLAACVPFFSKNDSGWGMVRKTFHSHSANGNGKSGA